MLGLRITNPADIIVPRRFSLSPRISVSFSTRLPPSAASSALLSEWMVLPFICFRHFSLFFLRFSPLSYPLSSSSVSLVRLRVFSRPPTACHAARPMHDDRAWARTDQDRSPSIDRPAGLRTSRSHIRQISSTTFLPRFAQTFSPLRHICFPFFFSPGSRCPPPSSFAVLCDAFSSRPAVISVNN